MKTEKRTRNFIGIFLVFLLVGISCYLFWTQFMRKSDFAWTVSQNGYWDAVVEMGIAFWLYSMLFLFRFSRKWMRYLCIGVVILVFAYLHSFFWAVLVVSTYMFFTYMLGHAVCRIISRRCPELKSDFDFCILNGIAAVIIIVAIASSFSVGTPSKLRIILPIVFALVLAFERNYIQTLWKRLNGVLAQKDDGYHWNSAIVMAIICTMTTIMICRANLGTDYDSLWYSYRSQYVLAPEHGIFDKLTMVACVYNYPKGIETFSLPFSGLNTYSYLIGINIAFAIMLLFTGYKTARSLGVGGQISILVPLMLTLTPAITNSAITGKGDISYFYIQTVAGFRAINALKSGEGSYYFAALSLLRFSFAFKSTSLLFSSLMIVVLIAFWVIKRPKGTFHNPAIVLFPIGGLLVTVLKTWVVTGYPINTLVTSVFQKIGIPSNYPFTFPSARVTSVDTLLTDLLKERASRLFRLLFCPGSDTVTTERSWWGPLFTVVWIIAIVMIVFRPRYTWKKCHELQSYGFVVVSFLLCSGFSVVCMMLLDTPDGNYFMVLYALTYIYIATEFMSFSREMIKKLQLIAAPLALSSFLLSLATSQSWCVGVTPINLRNYGYYDHVTNYIEPTLYANNMGGIYQYLSGIDSQRMLIFAGNPDAALCLPGQTELFEHQITWAPNTTENVDALETYSEYVGMDGFLVFSDYTPMANSIDLLLNMAMKGDLSVEYQDDSCMYLAYEKDRGNVDPVIIQYLTVLNERG